MELDLSNDQELLRETTARFIQAECPLPTVRQLAQRETALPDGYLRAAAELGWFAMLVPEEHGGGNISGEGLRDLAIVAEERGRGLQPGPFVSMNVAAWALAAAGSDAQQRDLLPRLCSGELVATWVPGDPAAAWVPGDAITATAVASEFLLSGSASLVQDGERADWLLITAGGPEGTSQFMVEAATPGITIEALVGHDITQHLARVSLREVKIRATSLVGTSGGGAAAAEHQLQLACVLSTAETVGAMDALFDMTRLYAIDRTAFGRPIGSFQAVKHQLADMSLSLEAGKAITAAAVKAVQESREDAGEIASMAKSWVGDTGIDIAQGCAQVFAGIGYTWEHDSHLFLRRITMNGLLFGQSDWHRERICRIHGL
jgi:alkylation response protein AidB-like acyl-CoA dehydrogenase